MTQSNNKRTTETSKQRRIRINALTLMRIKTFLYTLSDIVTRIILIDLQKLFKVKMNLNRTFCGLLLIIIFLSYF